MAIPRKRRVIRRVRRRRRRMYPSKGWGDSFSTAYRTVAKYTNWDPIWRAISDIRGLVNAEMYKFDVAETGTVVTSAGNNYTVPLASIPQGDGDANRTGNSIFARSLNIRGQVLFNSSGTDPQFIRIMVVEDLQQNADTSPTMALVLQNTGTATAYNSHLLNTTVGRFKVLFSRILQLDSVNWLVRPFYINLPMRHHIRFNGTSGSDIQRGGLYLLAMSSESVQGPKIIYDSRLSYHDN